MWWWFLISVVIVLFVWFDVIGKVFAYYRLCKALKPIPGWPTHWLLGNLHQVSNTEEFFQSWHRDVQKNRWRLTRMWLGPFLGGVSITHPDSLKEILKAPKNPSTYKFIESWLGKGLLIANGAKWFRNRRLLTPAFHFDILKPYVQVYNECTAILLSKWQKMADNGEPVDVYEGIGVLSLDIILRCAFSYRSNCQDDQVRNKYIEAVDKICYYTSNRVFNLVYRIHWFYRYFTSDGREYYKALKVVHDEAEDIIKRRRSALGMLGDNKGTVKLEDIIKRSGTGKAYLDFLDILLTAQDENGCGLTDLEIRNEVDTFMFEGHDTTATAQLWTLYLLAKHPEHQEKCREEIRSVLQGREEIELNDLAHLEYITWCIKESMRLYPPVHFILRRPEEDVTLDGYTFPKGTRVGINIYDIHHNTDLWENPEEFDPLRFHPNNFTDMHVFAYIPFSAGPRNCIGQNFAMNEMKVVLSSIINRFSMSLVEDHRVGALPAILLKSPTGVKIWLKSAKTSGASK